MGPGFPSLVSRRAEPHGCVPGRAVGRDAVGQGTAAVVRQRAQLWIVGDHAPTGPVAVDVHAQDHAGRRVTAVAAWVICDDRIVNFNRVRS